MVLPHDEEIGDVDRLGDVIMRLGVTHILTVPSLYRALLERVADRLVGLAAAIVAGEACPLSLVRRHHELLPGVALFNEYGPTEATVWATAHRLSADDDRVLIGRPIPGTTLRTVGPELETTLAGAAGELLIASPGVVAGYLGGEQPEKFIELDGGRWYRTGDIARLENGVAEFVGRTDDQLNVGGIRLEPGEVEAELLRIDGIHDAVVVASGEPPALVAHLEADVVDETALRAALAERLPAGWVPRRFQLHEALPRTANGKVDRVAASRLASAPQGRSVGAAASGPRSEVVVAAWREVLGREDVTADTDFFAIGGDSLSAVSIVVAVGDALGHPIPIATLLTGRTPSGMADLLGDTASVATVAAATEEFPIVTFQPGSPGGPLVLMTAAWDDVFGYQAWRRACPTRSAQWRSPTSNSRDVPWSTPSTGWSTRFARSRPCVERQPVTRVSHSSAGRSAEWSLWSWPNRLVASGQDDRRSSAVVDTFFPGEERHLWSNRWWKYKSMLRPGALPEVGHELQLMVQRRARRLSASLGRRLLAYSGATLPDEQKRTSVGHFPVESLGHRIGAIDVPVVLYRASTTNPRRHDRQVGQRR